MIRAYFYEDSDDSQSGGVGNGAGDVWEVIWEMNKMNL